MANTSILVIKNTKHEWPGLINKVLMENGLRSTLYAPSFTSYKSKFPNPKDYKAVFVLGGPQSANDAGMKPELEFINQALQGNTPYFGICLGMQMLAKAAGGTVYRAVIKEVGFTYQDKEYEVKLTDGGKEDPLFQGLEKAVFPVFQLHGETVGLNAKIRLLGTGGSESQIPVQVIKVGDKAYGFQPHIEHTRSWIENLLPNDNDLRELDANDVMRYYDSVAKVREEFNARIINRFLQIAGVVR